MRDTRSFRLMSTAKKLTCMYPSLPLEVENEPHLAGSYISDLGSAVACSGNNDARIFYLQLVPVGPSHQSGLCHLIYPGNQLRELQQSGWHRLRQYCS